MFARIGDILPRLRDYERLFGSHERLVQAISMLYVDILEFCADVKSLFRAHRLPSSTTNNSFENPGMTLTLHSGQSTCILEIYLEAV